MSAHFPPPLPSRMDNSFFVSSRSPRREFWLFFLFALVVIGAGIGLRDPWPADEPRFALSAQQMVESGDWLIPHRGHEIYADKPPAFMVMQAAAFEVTRNWRIAFLLPSLLAALGTLVLVYDLGRRLWDHRAGLYAGLALLCTFQFVYQAKRAQIDPTVTFFITLANYGLLRHFLLGANWRWYGLGCFAAGLGVITKGVGILALLMAVPYVFACRRHWNFVVPMHKSAARWALGIVAFAAAIALWLVPLALAVARHPASEYAAYLHDILFRQTAARYTDSWDHQQPPWYYLGVIAGGWLPLWLVWFGTAPEWVRAFKARDARVLLPLVWAALVVVFFSIPSGKRDMYILPALPMVALACAPYLPPILERRGFRLLALALLIVLGVALVGTGARAWSGHWTFANVFAEQRGFGAGAALWNLLIVLGAGLLVCAAVFRLRRAPLGLVVGFAGLWLLWGLWASPLLNDSSSARGLMRQAGAMIGPDAELALVGWKEQNLLLADRKVAEFGFVEPAHRQLAQAIRWQEARPESRWVFILAEAMTPCIDAAKSRYVGHANRREWWLFRADAVALACRGGNVPVPERPMDVEAE